MSSVPARCEDAVRILHSFASHLQSLLWADVWFSENVVYETDDLIAKLYPSHSPPPQNAVAASHE